MHTEMVPNRNSQPCILLRESYREDGKVRKRTLANLSKLPRLEVSGGSAQGQHSIDARGVAGAEFQTLLQSLGTIAKNTDPAQDPEPASV